MTRKYGKKKQIMFDPLAYNIGLIGESGIGKSTLAKEVCQKLVGDEGYIGLNIGKEDAYDAINDVVSADIPDWATFSDFVDDVVENKLTDYKDLKIIIVDTYDQLMDLAEKEVIRMHNKENPDKRVTSIKAAFGGFQAGEDKALDIVLDKLWELKNVGVHFWCIGHTKRRDLEDPKTGETYSSLTTNMSQKYFNGLKTKLHFLGVAFIDREIVKQKTGKKNPVTKQEIIKGKVVSESRCIAFRDDTYSIDSKSRFAEIVDTIPLDRDAFIEALTDAIKKEYERTTDNGNFEKDKKKQEKDVAEEEIKAAKKAAADKEKEAHEMYRTDYIEYIQANLPNADKETKMNFKTMLTEAGCANIKDPDLPIEILEKTIKDLGGELLT